ncbi:MAG: glycosyltransferase family 4 protein [Anaerolineae bacterium]
MNLVLDGRYIQDHYPGVGRYAFELAAHLAPVSGDDRLLLLRDPVAPNRRFDIEALAANPRVELLAVSCSPLGLRQHLIVPPLVRRAEGTVYLAPHWGVPKGLRCPVVLTVHDLTPWLLREKSEPFWKRWAYQRLLQSAVHRAKAVVVSSQATREDLERLIPRHPPVTVAPLGVGARFHSRSHDVADEGLAGFDVRPPFVLCVNTNRPHKNLGRLLEAWVRLPEPLREAWQLVLVGAVDPRWEDPLIHARRLGAGESVRRLGQVSEGELAALYAAAEVGVVPSLYEGFGLPALEMMASGVAVAVSRRSALPEVVGDAGMLFDPTDVGAIASALMSLMTDAAIRELLAAKGRERAAAFTWDRTAALVRQAIDDALGGRG